MSKPLKIAPWVVPHDLQSIYDYHKRFSPAKAERIVAEYDRIIALLEVNPLIFRERENRLEGLSLRFRHLSLILQGAGIHVAGRRVFHAHRRPSWIGEQLAARVK